MAATFQQLVESTFTIGAEEDLLATIAFADERLEALAVIFFELSDNGEFEMVVGELLKHFSRKTRTQIEKRRGQLFLVQDEPLSALVIGACHEIEDVCDAVEGLLVGLGFVDVHGFSQSNHPTFALT